ncbi:DgyrCDS13372 [Dimorphilus gyrociliatus]|uniref:DgyrCDS13372 n=1 Tax=Dimorphilus gyrociliatus TaxID=2664684 RepID=A0A7I8WAG2_9ANNE|nr:DgyrCDS13372 [Dimorphilus gyrociliatus]
MNDSNGYLSKGEIFKILPLGIPKLENCILNDMVSIYCSWKSNLDNTLIPMKLKQAIIDKITREITCDRGNFAYVPILSTQDLLICNWEYMSQIGYNAIRWNRTQTLLIVYDGKKLITTPILFPQPQIESNKYCIKESSNSLTLSVGLAFSEGINFICKFYPKIDPPQLEFYAISILKSQWNTEIHKFLMVCPQFCGNESSRNTALYFEHKNLRYNTNYSSIMYFKTKYYPGVTEKFLTNLTAKELHTRISEPSALPEIPPGAFILDSDRRHLTILWKPLPIPFRNGPIAQYSLQISSEKSMTNVSGDVNYYKFKNLTTTNPSIKVIGFTKTQQISPLLNNSDHQFNLSKVSYDKEKSCFSVNKTSNGNRKIDWKIPGIKVSRYVIYYCIVEGPEALTSKGCIVSNDSDWYGLKTIIVSNTTNFLVMNESLFMEDKIYDFGVSGDKFLNDKWHSTGLIPSTCLNRTQSDYKVETADQPPYLWILTIFFIIPIVGFVQFIKRFVNERIQNRSVDAGEFEQA